MSSGSTPPRRAYSRDEVQAILSRALESSHATGDDLSYEELVAVGRELGVDERAIEAAASTVGSELEVARAVDARVRSRRHGFLRHFVSFVLVNGMLAALNLVTGGPLWFVWPIFGWGIGLLFHARSAYLPDREAIARKAKKRIDREREKARAIEARRARKEGKGGDPIEAAVKDVVAGTLGVIADAIEDSRRRSKGPASPSGSPPVRGGQDKQDRVRVNVGGVRVKATDDAQAEAEAAEEEAREARRDRRPR